MTWESFLTGVLALFIFLLMFAVVFAMRGILQNDNTDEQKKKDKVQPILQKDDPQPTSDQLVGYQILIHKALEEGKLRHFIIGYGEYYIPSRDERFQNLTDYVLLLWDFNWYHAKYPDSNLKEIYESTLEEMLCSEIPSYIYCAAMCVLVHKDLEQNPNFHFELTDEEKYLRLVVSSMELHHESIVEFIDKLYDHRVYAERFYRVVLDKSVSYLAKKEKQEDTAEQCQQCEEEAVFVLYDGPWAGKAENGEDKIFLKVFEDECVITYESLTRNCYATPPKEDVRSDVRHRSLSTISTWSLEDLLLFINRAFHLSISICDCCSEEQYRAWIEQQNTEFYSMEIMVDGTRQECIVRRVNEKSCEEIRFQGQTYFWKESKAIHGLHNYDYAVEVHLNEKPYYLYYTEMPNKNMTLFWTVNQITESTFEMLKHQPCDHEKIVFGRRIGQIDGNEVGRRSTIYKVLALATGRTIGYYQADDGTRNICLETRGRNMTFEEKIAPIYIPILAEYQMKMHTTSGEAYCFTLTGLKAYYPNTGGYCGCGSDEWCFHCKYNGENYILRFCDDSSYGTYWDCALIHKENAEQLDKLSAIEWLKLVQKSATKIFCLHPDTINDAKNIVQDTSSRCGSISDDGFYGR